MNAINYLIISYFGAVLFPADLVSIQVILEVARRASSRLDKHGLYIYLALQQKWTMESVLRWVILDEFSFIRQIPYQVLLMSLLL